jgi:alkylhydroperoxidase family enzyme
MSIINTQTNETAQGEVRKIYDELLRRGLPFIPKPVQVMSASPELMTRYWPMITWVLDHPRLSRQLLAYIRLGVALTSDYPYCVELNTAALQQMMQLTPEQLAMFREDPSKAQLSEAERELVAFVVRASSEPEEITANDVQRLRDLGWADPDIFDATFMGAFMLTSGVLFNTFKMHED